MPEGGLQMKKPSSRIAGFFVVLALSMCGASASAQLMEEVVVTAQKREQSAQDVSIAVNAFSGDQLNALGVTGAKDLADYTAGVQINMEYGNAPTFTIRGVNVNDFGAGTSPAAAVYVDGIYKASNINSGVQLFDLERVEILKGPQGTLWGKNTTGGAVNVVTRKPSAETEGFFQVGFGNHNKVEFEGAFGGALTDTLSTRLSVQSITSDGPYKSVSFPGQPVLGTSPIDPTADSRTQAFGIIEPDPGGQGTLAVRGQFLWELENADILGILHYARDRGQNAPTTNLFNDPDPYDEEVSAEFLPQRDSEFYGASVQVDWEISDTSKFVSLTGFDYFDRNGGIDTGGPAGIPADSAFTQIYLQEFEQFSQEFRYEVQGEKLFWLIGGFYSNSTLNQNDDDHYSIGYFTAPFNYRFEHENTTFAVFAHTELDLSDQFKLTVGVRHNDEERDQPFNKLWFFGGPDTPAGEAGGVVLADNQTELGGLAIPSQNFQTDGVTYRIGLDWHPTDEMLLYYSHSKGLKSGGFRSDALTSNGMLVAFQDEEVLAHEVGLKWDPSDTLRINAAVFYYDYQNPQQRVPVDVPPFGQLSTMTNLDSAEVTGFEAELLWNPSPGFDVGLNLSLLDTEISDSVQTAVDGNKLAFAPDSAYAAFARYEGAARANLGWSIQANVAVTGDHFLTVFNDAIEEQNHTKVGISAALWNDEKGWELSAYGKNLTDEIYVTNSFGDGGVFISEPMTFGVRLKYNIQ